MEEGKGEKEERQTGSSQAFKSCLLAGGVIISSSLSVIFRMNLKETFVIYKPAERRQKDGERDLGSHDQSTASLV